MSSSGLMMLPTSKRFKDVGNALKGNASLLKQTADSVAGFFLHGLDFEKVTGGQKILAPLFCQDGTRKSCELFDDFCIF